MIDILISIEFCEISGLGTLKTATTLLKAYEEAEKQKGRLPWVRASRSVVRNFEFSTFLLILDRLSSQFQDKRLRGSILVTLVCVFSSITFPKNSQQTESVFITLAWELRIVDLPKIYFWMVPCASLSQHR